ncbi:kinase A anchor protein, partial [Elsinoe ampelina]
GKKPALTHFLCLPLVDQSSRPELEESLGNFRLEVSGGSHGERDTPHVPAGAIRPVGSIHLTIGVMSLKEEGRVDEAVRYLQSLNAAALFAPFAALDGSDTKSMERCSSGLTIDLISLHPMQSAKATTILYASPAEPTNCLYTIANKLRKLFTDAGFLLPDTRPLKLHATIVNTIYVKGRDQTPETGPVPDSVSAAAKERLPFTDPSASPGPTSKLHTRRLPPLKLDARSLIEMYKDNIWARNIVIDRVAFCEMGAKNVLNDNGEVVDQVYREVASIPL